MKNAKSYSMEEVASELGISKQKLFKFLRRYNFICGFESELKVLPEIIYNGYIEVIELPKTVGIYQKLIISKTMYFTPRGIVWIKKVYNLLLPKL